MEIFSELLILSGMFDGMWNLEELRKIVSKLLTFCLDLVGRQIYPLL